MPVSWNTLFQEVANLLGAVKGSDPAESEANYLAAFSTSTIVNPDFVPQPIKDAVVNTMEDVVRTICETPKHPDKSAFMSFTAPLVNLARIPEIDASSTPTIGFRGAVYDTADLQVCFETSADKVRSYTRFAATLYAGQSLYWYAIVGNVLLHTRPSVRIEVPVFLRPTSFVGNILLKDHYERALVVGAVAMLAPKEGMYQQLHEDCFREYSRQLDAIRAAGGIEVGAATQAAPLPVL